MSNYTKKPRRVGRPTNAERARLAAEYKLANPRPPRPASSEKTPTTRRARTSNLFPEQAVKAAKPHKTLTAEQIHRAVQSASDFNLDVNYEQHRRVPYYDEETNLHQINALPRRSAMNASRTAPEDEAATGQMYTFPSLRWVNAIPPAPQAGTYVVVPQPPAPVFHQRVESKPVSSTSVTKVKPLPSTSVTKGKAESSTHTVKVKRGPGRPPGPRSSKATANALLKQAIQTRATGSHEHLGKVDCGSSNSSSKDRSAAIDVDKAASTASPRQPSSPTSPLPLSTPPESPTSDDAKTLSRAEVTATFAKVSKRPGGKPLAMLLGRKKH